MDLPELIHEVVDIMSGQLGELFGEESRVDDDHCSLCVCVYVCMCVLGVNGVSAGNLGVDFGVRSCLC